MAISAQKRIHFEPHNTVIYLDEIQDCGEARPYLKTFVNDGRYDVIASGSLLGLRNYNPAFRQDVPVGYEHSITLKSLDFEEFLWAIGISEDVISYLKDCYKNEKPIMPSVQESMFRYLKEYLVIGGMPSAINTFLATNNIKEVTEVQRELLEEYQDDFGKHINKNGEEETDAVFLSRILKTYRSLPQQLAKENHKFQYSVIDKGAKAREYETAIEWLLDYGLILKVENLRSPALPLAGNAIENDFKIYFSDTGFLFGALEEGTAADVLAEKDGVYSGAIYENLVATFLDHQNLPLYYFRPQQNLEVDFVSRINNKSTLIEVKAKTGKTTSADRILAQKAKYHADQLIKFGQYNIGRLGKRLTLPTYLAFLLE